MVTPRTKAILALLPGAATGTFLYLIPVVAGGALMLAGVAAAQFGPVLRMRR